MVLKEQSDDEEGDEVLKKASKIEGREFSSTDLIDQTIVEDNE